MGAAQSTVLEAVELEFHRLARKKRYLTLQELVLMRCTYGVDLAHIGVLYRMDENADGRFTLDELRAFAAAAYATVTVGFRRGSGGNSNNNNNNNNSSSGGPTRRPPLRAATTGGGGAAASSSLPPLPVVPPLGALSCGGGAGNGSTSGASLTASLGWSGPEAMPGLHRHAALPLVPAHCSLHLWRRTRSPEGRRDFLRWAARLFSEGGAAVVPMARADAQAAAAVAGNGAARPPASSSSSSTSVVAMVREEALMGVHELFDLQRAHGLAFEAWLALLRAAAAEGARRGTGGGICEGDDAEDDAALLREVAAAASSSPAKRHGKKGARRRRRRVGRSDASHKEEDDDDFEEGEEDEDSGDLFSPAAEARAPSSSARPPPPPPLVPLSVLRVFAASVLDGAVGVVDGWFDPADLDPGGRVARATNSALLLSAAEREALAGDGWGAASEAAAAATRSGPSPSKSLGGRRSSAPSAPPFIPALW